MAPNKMKLSKISIILSRHNWDWAKFLSNKEIKYSESANIQALTSLNEEHNSFFKNRLVEFFKCNNGFKLI